MTEDDLTNDKVAVPRKRLSVTARLDDRQSLWVAHTDPTISRTVTEAQNEIRRTAHREHALVAGKPKVTITVTVDWSAFAFPQDAHDIYDAERLGQALGMDVPDTTDTLVFHRSPRLLP